MLKKNRKRYFAKAILSAALVTLPLMAHSDVKIKLAHSEAEGDLLSNPYWTFTQVFGQELNSLSGGEMSLQVFPNGQLGDLESLAEQNSRGMVEMTAGLSAGHLASYFPPIQVLEQPYLFPSLRVAREALNGPFGQRMADASAEASGIRILAYLPSAFRNFSNSVRPIHSPEDMDGLKIRTQSIPIHLAMVRALGASPTPIPWSELYSALQTGVVDGQENAPYTMLLSNLQEVQDYYTLDHHLVNLSLITVNENFYQNLDERQQKMLASAAQSGAFAMLGVIRAAESQDMHTIEQAGVEIYTPTPEEMDQFAEATQQAVRDVLLEEVDEHWFDELQEAIDQFHSEAR